MSLVRKVLLVIVSSALAFFLLLSALDFGLVKIIGSPEPIKKILADSGIYKSIVPSGLDSAKKATSASGEIGLGNPAVRSAAEASFTPQLLQDSANTIVDSVYRWLNGLTAQPDFKIDLSSTKSTFADKVAGAARQKAASLPICTDPAAIIPADPFSATCLPPGVSPDQVAADVRNTIISGEGFLENPVISADSIKSSGSKASIFVSDLKETPKAFQTFKSTPGILAILAILALLAVVFLSKTRLRGLRIAGFIFVSVGIFLILFGLATNTTVKNKVIPLIEFESEALQTNVRTLVNDLVRGTNSTYILIGTIYSTAGALAVGGTYYIRRREPATGVLKPASVPEPATVVPQDKKTEPEPPKKPKKRKIEVK